MFSLNHHNKSILYHKKQFITLFFKENSRKIVVPETWKAESHLPHGKIYSKKGYIDIDEFIKICPKDFEEIIKQSKAFLQEELNKLQEERH